MPHAQRVNCLSDGMQIPEGDDDSSQDSTLELDPDWRHLWYDTLRALHRSLWSENRHHFDDPFPGSRKSRKPLDDAAVT